MCLQFVKIGSNIVCVQQSTGKKCFSNRLKVVLKIKTQFLCTILSNFPNEFFLLLYVEICFNSLKVGFLQKF